LTMTIEKQTASEKWFFPRQALLFLLLPFFYCIGRALVRIAFYFGYQSQRLVSPVIGYPLFYDFDINRVFYEGYAEFLFPPVFAWLAFRWVSPWVMLSLPEDRCIANAHSDDAPRWQRWVSLSACGFFLGRLGFSSTQNLLACEIAGALVYPPLVIGLARLFHFQFPQRRADWFESAINLTILPWVFVGYGCVSKSIGFVLDGQSYNAGWIPYPLAFLSTLLASLYALYLIRTQHSLQRTERGFLFTLLTPLATAHTLPQVATQPLFQGGDMFHQGEAVVPTLLLLGGAIPWKEFVFVHGFLADCFQLMPGMLKWGHNAWAGMTGAALWLDTAFIAIFGLYAQALYRKNALFLMAVIVIAIAAIPGLGGVVSFRFGLVALCLLCAYRFFLRSTPSRAFALALTAVLHLFVSAETLFLCIGLAIATLWADLQEGTQSHSWPLRVKRTLWFGGFSLLLLGLGFLFLSSHGAAKAFWDFHTGTASGHRFSGGIPLFKGRAYYLTLGTTAIAFFMLAFHWARRKQFGPNELLMLALLIFQGLYYQKYLSRADAQHLQLYWSTVYPLFFCVLYRATELFDGFFPRVRFSAGAAGLLLCALIYRGHDLWLALSLNPQPPQLYTYAGAPRLGPTTLSPFWNDLSHAFRGRLGKDPGPIFDFTNQPLFFHYLLGFSPASRYTFVSTAIHPRLQHQLIQDLESTRPRYVIYEAKGSDLTHWDGIPNSTRHYLVSRYLLQNYVPKEWVGAEQLILERATESGSDPKTRFALYSQYRECAWGSIPHHWSAPYSSADLPTIGQGKWQATEEGTLLEVPEFALAKPATLDLFLEESPGEELRLRLGNGALTWLSHPAKRRVYRLPVGSCPHWYTAKNSRVLLQHEQPLGIAAVRWTLEPVTANALTETPPSNPLD
jgi:hypothetical protein